MYIHIDSNVSKGEKSTLNASSLIINKTNYLAITKKDEKFYFIGSNNKLIKTHNEDSKLPEIFGNFKTCPVKITLFKPRLLISTIFWTATPNLLAIPNKVSPDLTTVVSNSFKNFCVCLVSVTSFNSPSNNEGSKEQACKYKNIENEETNEENHDDGKSNSSNEDSDNNSEDTKDQNNEKYEKFEYI